MNAPPARTDATSTRTGRRERIFISYRRADSAGHAGRLKDDLTGLLGDRLFMDVSDIVPGTDFENALQAELTSCAAVLAVIGPRWLEAFESPRDGLDYVRLELRQALAQDGVHVVPVLVQGATLPATAKLPADLQALAKRQATGIRDDRWKDDVAHLARELRVALKLNRFPLWWIVPGVIAVAASAAWLALNRQPAPTAFSRSDAHEVTAAAVAKAAKACKPAQTQPGECPVVLQFAPEGTIRNVYFASGSCILKAPPFGDCVLQRLASVSIPPFNSSDVAEVELSLVVGEGGSVKVTIEQ